jgi:hypothetical protein
MIREDYAVTYQTWQNVLLTAPSYFSRRRTALDFQLCDTFFQALQYPDAMLGQVVEHKALALEL